MFFRHNTRSNKDNQILIPMPFNDIKFWLIFPLIFIVYWAIPMRLRKLRNVFLLIVSYMLYMSWKPAFAIVLLAVTAITYCGGYLIGKQQDNRRKKTLCWCFALLGLLPLLVFKYYNFLNESLTSLLSHAGLHFVLPGLNWAIPVGISFFTFQAVGYMLDVYHNRTRTERNFLDYALFVSFFPQVTSGPISKAAELMPQIKSSHSFDYEQAKQGLKYFLWGMFLKVVLADRAGIYVDMVFDNYQKLPAINCLGTSFLYSIQIYADFAGYSIMAVGTGKLLGFNLINNFNRPYFSVSVTDFWRRWHISLSRWLKDQIYIPLGGSRCSRAKNYLNILVTFIVSGIWHGANWTFIVWGVIHGLCQIVEKIFGWQKKNYHGWSKAGRILLTFFIVNFAWVIFRSPSIGFATDFIAQSFAFNQGISVSLDGKDTLLFVAVALIPFLTYETIREFAPKLYMHLKDKWYLRWAVYLCLSAMIFLNGVLDGGNFIYVNF